MNWHTVITELSESIQYDGYFFKEFWFEWLIVDAIQTYIEHIHIYKCL